MCTSRLGVSTLFFLTLTLSSGRAANSSDIQWRKPGESITIHCSSTTKQESLYLYHSINNKVIILHWNLGDTKTIDEQWRPRVKTEKPNKTGTTELLITIANLTAQDTGFYLCEYTDLKKPCIVKTRGAGSVLLVVHDAVAEKECDLTFPMILVGVLCIVILLLLSVLVSMWIVRKMKTMHVTAVRRPHRAKPSDVYEDMRSTCRR
ncbi:unnamed protein product [Lota lota]